MARRRSTTSTSSRIDVLSLTAGVSTDLALVAPGGSALGEWRGEATAHWPRFEVGDALEGCEVEHPTNPLRDVRRFEAYRDALHHAASGMKPPPSNPLTALWRRLARWRRPA
jgi:hypothetical protein